MSDTLEFEPDWFSPPGEAIAECLRRSRKSLSDFAFEMDLDGGRVEQLIEGQLAITTRVARQLEKSLGISAEFWETREAQYRRDMVRLAANVPSDVAKKWLRDLPIADMAKMGWVQEQPEITGKVAECFRYFDVPSIECYERRMAELIGEARLRTSQTLVSNRASLATWLQRGEIEARKIDCNSWSAARLQETIPAFRKLTMLREPSKFLPRLQTMCADAGVALVIAKTPKGCRASGATKFLSDDKALLLLSFRYLSDDHFWFSFFHECGHLVLHGRESVFIEGEGHENVVQEEQANDFAQKALIPEPWHRLLTQLPASKKDVLRFAARVGVSPGIVVGQLQHRGRISHNFLNYLKRRYEWTT